MKKIKLIDANNYSPVERSEYSVLVGNIGTVYSGTDRKKALRIFSEYVKQSGFLPSGYGRVYGENVTLFADQEIEKEFFGSLSRNA